MHIHTHTHKKWHGFPRHPRGTMPRRVPVFLHGGDPQEAYTMPYVLKHMENLRKQKGYRHAIYYCRYHFITIFNWNC